MRRSVTAVNTVIIAGICHRVYGVHQGKAAQTGSLEHNHRVSRLYVTNQVRGIRLFTSFSSASEAVQRFHNAGLLPIHKTKTKKRDTKMDNNTFIQLVNDFIDLVHIFIVLDSTGTNSDISTLQRSIFTPVNLFF